ncbi:hypothetical protein IQ268_21700 [Oculatella sp. LEGE 06141]|nr:hypothetical protein [Oculatella sp. LEGE 06141]MBE9181180.1 hypothetical protein [Oculatella sp. LEGE 06141]
MNIVLGRDRPLLMKRKVIPVITFGLLAIAAILAMPSPMLPGQSAATILAWSIKHPWMPLLPAIKLQTIEADFRTVSVFQNPSELAVWTQAGRITMDALYYRSADNTIRFTRHHTAAMNAIRESFGTEVVDDFAAAQPLLHTDALPPTTLYRGKRYGYEVSYYPDPVQDGYIAKFAVVSLTVVDCTVSNHPAGSKPGGIDMSCFSPSHDATVRSAGDRPLP